MLNRLFEDSAEYSPHSLYLGQHMRFEKQIENVSILKNSINGFKASPDALIVEEPLEILLQASNDLNSIKICTTMRTPGHDQELALGFLFCEGILNSIDHVMSIQEVNRNQVLVKLNKAVQNKKHLNRHFHSTSSCGVCGIESIDHLYNILPPQTTNKKISIKHNIITRLKNELEHNASIFSQTGGNHTAALIDLKGKLVSFKEDVGRHNALDKLIGECLQNELVPLSDHILLLSGRISFELIQKSLMTGIQVVTAIGAPTNLAVKLAREFDLTLIGFLKDQSYNVYHGEENITT